MNHVLDSITNQFRGFLTGALVEIINQEKVAARAAELQRVRLVASDMLRDAVFLSGTWTLDQAIDELFKRAALPDAVAVAGASGRSQLGGVYGARVPFVSGLSEVNSYTGPGGVPMVPDGKPFTGRYAAGGPLASPDAFDKNDPRYANEAGSAPYRPAAHGGAPDRFGGGISNGPFSENANGAPSPLPGPTHSVSGFPTTAPDEKVGGSTTTTHYPSGLPGVDHSGESAPQNPTPAIEPMPYQSNVDLDQETADHLAFLKETVQAGHPDPNSNKTDV